MATFQNRGGRWRAIIRRGGQTLSKTFRIRAAAETWARRTEDAIEAGTLHQQRAAELTLGDLIDQVDRETRAVRPMAPSRRTSLAHWRRRLGERPVGALTGADVVAFARARRQAGAAPATIQMDVGFLRDLLAVSRSMLGLAIPDIIADARPTLRLLRLVGKPVERERRPTADELARLRAYWHRRLARELPMLDLLDFSIGTAMRLGEVVRLRWEDLDAERRLITVRDRKDPRRKDGNDQRVPLLAVGGIDPLAIIERQPRTNPLIFPFHEDAVGRAWRRAVQALGIADLRWHDLRHEGVSRLFEAGYSIEQVALVSGHRSWSSLRRYTNLRPEQLTAGSKT